MDFFRRSTLLVKYLCPKPSPEGKHIDVVYHNTGKPFYWQVLLESKGIKEVVITEGSKKALSGLSHGVATIACLGTWMGTNKVKAYVDDITDITVHTPKQGLKLLIKPQVKLFIAFDSDAIHKDSVHSAIVTLAESVISEGSEVAPIG